MKFLVVLLAVAAVDARSFYPKKIYGETYFDKTKFDPTVFDDKFNEIFSETKPDYYKYVVGSGDDYNKNKKEFVKDKLTFDFDDDTYYDPKEKYDFDTFARFFTSNPVLASLAKYFPVKETKDKDNTYYYGYYPVPKEVVELARGSKDLKDILRTVVKYYYNLPENFKATAVAKYDFENVVKFLLQVYYNIPNVAYPLTNYYDIPSTVVAELRTQYDIRKVIEDVVTKFFELTPFEREYYTRRFLDVPAVVRTLVKVYYGVPQLEKYDTTVEDYYYNEAEVLRKYAEEFVKKGYNFFEVFEKIFENRVRLTETEKEFYDRFFNFDEYLGFLVKTYYYGVYYGKTYGPFDTTFANYYTKKGFYELVSKVYKYKYYDSAKTDYKDEEFYPVEYYLKYLFGGDNKSYYPRDTTTFVPNKGYYPFEGYNNGPKTFFKRFLDTFFGGYYPEESYYKYEDKYFPGKYEGPFSSDFYKKYFYGYPYFYNKKGYNTDDDSTPYNFFEKVKEGTKYGKFPFYYTEPKQYTPYPFNYEPVYKNYGFDDVAAKYFFDKYFGKVSEY